MYNVAPYIERCARSLFSQTFESCEFIFVDDCSTDNSSEQLMELLMGEFSHLRSRVALVRHASNLGVSEARNTALTTAKGKFVIFVDGDDWVDPDLAEELFIEHLVNNSDVVFSNFYHVENGHDKVKRIPSFGGRMGTLQMLVSQGFGVPNRIWGGMIRRSVIEDNSLRFDPQISMGEDFLFLAQVIYYSRDVAHASSPLYYYNADNEHSAMQRITRRKQLSYIRSVLRVDHFLEDKEFRGAKYLMFRNLQRWLLLRRGDRYTPRALVVRGYAFLLNVMWWLRWQI